MKHEWGPSTLNHGEAQCRRCKMTNREATVLGDECPAWAEPRPANDNAPTKTQDEA